MKIFTIKNGFILIGLINIGGILTFSHFFTNEVLNQADPVVMSNFGLVVIMAWGLANISVAKSHAKVNWLVGVFALEKLIYVITWSIWISNHDLAPVYSKDFTAGIYYSIYGPMDFAFMIFFISVFVSNRNNKST